MKKMMMTMVGTALLMSSCGTYTGTGAVVGAQLGTILGSAVGGISGGWRGSDIGAITGMAGGAMVGAAIGAAADQKAEQQAMEREEAYRRRHMEREMPQYPPQGYGTQGQAGDDRVDFGIAGPTGSLTPNPSPKGEGNYKGEGSGNSNTSGGWRMTPDGSFSQTGPGNQREGNFKITSLVELRNVHLMEADGDGVLRRGEQMKLVFELMNRADRTLYNVCPMVTDLTHNKHVFISPNMAIESIATGTGVRYTATIQADNRLKDGELVIHIGVMVESRELASVAQEMVIRTAKK
jgi:hypothetical protein